jgi:XrtN system VIT domain protein
MQLKTRLTDGVYITGLFLIILSLAYFYYCTLHAIRNEFGFFFHYGIMVFYLLILFFDQRLKKGRDGLSPLFLLLILFFISCWSINKEMHVFQTPTPWFVVLQVVICVNYIAFSIWESIPKWLQHISLFITGIAFITFSYLSLYLFPLYLISAMASILLGFSLHTFVPLLFAVFTIKLIRRITSRGSSLRAAWWSGTGVSVIIIITFIVQWSLSVTKINNAHQAAEMSNNKRYPSWMDVAQQAPLGWMAQKVLKSGLVYSVPYRDNDNWFWQDPSVRFDEPKKHDPLIMMASFIGGIPELTSEEQIKVLETMYDSRHQAQERLWRGDDLVTTSVNTNVHIWPRLHLAYTEKQLVVTNNQLSESWNRREEEAIYTFHLPEGAVVTSLSLWIHNKEEKGILTTKQKADTAYKTIVGLEKRDPSVVHWQEGNTVSVRVFPIAGGESRTFKIGVTAPLQLHQQQLVYENIYFDGPNATHTRESSQIAFDNPAKALRMPERFEQNKEGAYTYKGRYQPHWQITCTDEGLANNSFSFDSTTYTLQPYQPQRENGAINNVYLDINKAWTQEECEEVYALTKDKPVMVYWNKKMQTLTATNKAELFKLLRKQQFSLFPLFYITDPATALLITKNTGTSPSIDNLDNSDFKNQLQEYLTLQTKIRLFNLGEQLSPYLKALKEFRVFRYEQGNKSLLHELWVKNLFAVDTENDQRVVLEEAGMTITATPGTSTNTAPDHLLRLFSYNHILQKMGKGLLAGKAAEDALIATAAKAYVVTPISSLVVLETVQDYKRFNISDSENSLKNASLKSKGAVPEPHEWVLIILAVLTLLYVKFRPLFVKTRLS